MFGIIDIGNSNIHLALMSGNNIKDYITIKCEEGNRLLDIIKEKSIDKLIISYVSPSCFNKIGYIGNIEKIILGKEVKNLFKWTYDTMGMDRIANIYYLIKNGIDGIIISFGTMFVIDVVKDNKFVGGLIFPGYYSQIICVNFKSDFIKLKPYPVKEGLLGNNTEDAVRLGIFNILMKGIRDTVKNITEKYKLKNIIATGGESLFREHFPTKYDKYLTIKGIKLLAEDVYDCSWD